jgi:outer membrane protein
MKSSKLFVGSLSLLLICCFLFFYFFAFASGNGRIVYVDSDKLLNGYKGMIEARAEFQKKRTVWESNIDTLTKDVQDAIRIYSKDMALGTEKEKQLSKALIQTKQKQLMDYQSAIKQNAAQEEQRLNQQVLSTINAFLMRYGKKNGYKMILIAANGNIAYADPSMEITDRIVEELNKEYSVPVK